MIKKVRLNACRVDDSARRLLFVYALDSSTIGIQAVRCLSAKKYCFPEKIPIKETERKMILQVPEKFWRLYNLDLEHRVVSINGNNLLITVSVDIVEEKKYPS